MSVAPASDVASNLQASPTKKQKLLSASVVATNTDDDGGVYADKTLVNKIFDILFRLEKQVNDDSEEQETVNDNDKFHLFGSVEQVNNDSLEEQETVNSDDKFSLFGLIEQDTVIKDEQEQETVKETQQPKYLMRQVQDSGFAGW